MRTTLTLSDEVAASLKLASRKTGLSHKELVNLALQYGLQHLAHPRKIKPYRTKPKELGLKSGLSYDNIEELLAVVEGEDHK